MQAGWADMTPATASGLAAPIEDVFSEISDEGLHFFAQLQPLMVLLPPEVRVTRGGGIPVMAYHSGACRWPSRLMVVWALRH